MRVPKFSIEVLRSFFNKNIIGTMRQLKDVLGTSVDMTIFRKLRQLSYLTSYSHQGKYYTLEELTDFDSLGLWQFDVARFSKYGTLLKTAQALIEKSDKGYSASEMHDCLGVDVKEALLQLYRGHRVYREQFAGRYVYFCSEPKRRRQQHLRRLEDQPPLSTVEGLHVRAHEVRAAIILFYGILEERQRRLFAGLEALRFGHGGDSMISRLLNIDKHTVAQGRRQLVQRDIEIDRIRRKGGGRHPIKKKHLRSLSASAPS